MPRPNRWLALLLVALLMLPSLTASPAHAQDKTTLTVFAAASLTDAFTAIGAAFEQQHADVEVVFQFAGSSDLAAQLVEGAPADVFASANLRQMNVARDGGRMDGTPRTFAKNRLVVIVPRDNPANLRSVRDLAKEGVLLVVAAQGVPVRDYTNTMIDQLAAVYGDDFRDDVFANVVSEEENVRGVAAKVAFGEADAGVIYVSDVTPDIADEVRMIAVPDAYNTLATYPIAAVTESQHPDLAQAFIDYVLSDAGQDTLVAWGFTSVRIPEQPPFISLPSDGLLHVGGQVHNPLALRAADLRENYPQHRLEVTRAEATTAYEGVLLWDILSAAQVNFNVDVASDALGFYVVASSADGRQAVFSWAELAPTLGNQPVLVVVEADDTLRLVVPNDGADGRWLRDVVSLSVRDAPAIAD